MRYVPYCGTNAFFIQITYEKKRKKLNSNFIEFVMLNKYNITNEFTFITETITRFDKWV